MITYFTEFARWVGSTTGLVVSYVRGLLFNNNDDPTDSSIIETTVHKQDFDTNEVVEANDEPIVTVTETSYTIPPHIPLPEKLKNKKAVINMMTVNDAGFKWAVTRALNPVKRYSERATKILREQSKQYNWDGVSFPTALQDIDTFEKNNNVFVNVFGFDEEGGYMYPLRVPKGHNRSSVSLLLIEDESGDRAHFTVIKSLDELLNGRVLRRHCERFYCDICLEGFTSNKVLQSRMVSCGDASSDSDSDSDRYDCESYVCY